MQPKTVIKQQRVWSEKLVRDWRRPEKSTDGSLKGLINGTIILLPDTTRVCFFSLHDLFFDRCDEYSGASYSLGYTVIRGVAIFTALSTILRLVVAAVVPLTHFMVLVVMTVIPCLMLIV